MPVPGAEPHARRPTEAGCSSRRRPETVHQDRLACTAFAVANAAPNATNADLAPRLGSGVNIGGHAARWSGIEIPKVFPTVETALGGTLEVPTETLHMWLADPMLGVAVVHVAGAFEHRLEGRDVLDRMTYGRRRNHHRNGVDRDDDANEGPCQDENPRRTS